MRTIVNAKGVTPLRSSMSHAVRVDNMVYVSGATPFAGERQIAQGDFAAQCHQVMRNIQAVLADCGTSLANAVKMNVALRTMDNFKEFDAIFRTYFAEGNFPARMSTESPNLAHPDFLLSVDCIAVIG
jgi:2-iminobutanoate/2-iminopropanoate deaminase